MMCILNFAVLYVLTLFVIFYFAKRFNPNIRHVSELVATINKVWGMPFLWIPLINTGVILTILLGVIICKIVNFINDIKIK